MSAVIILKYTYSWKEVREFADCLRRLRIVSTGIL
jgi:hypothetical protein